MDIFVDLNNFAIKITNGGPGPAMIKNFALFVDEDRLNGTELSDREPVITKLGLSGFRYTATALAVGSFIMPGKPAVLYRIITTLDGD